MNVFVGTPEKGEDGWYVGVIFGPFHDSNGAKEFGLQMSKDYVDILQPVADTRRPRFIGEFVGEEKKD